MDCIRKALTHCKYPKWALDKVEKRCNRSSREVNDGANSQGTAGSQPITKEVKTKGHMVIPYTQGLCKSIKWSVRGIVFRPTLKVIAPSKTYQCPPRTRTSWSTKVGPCTGSSMVTLLAMMNTWGKPLGPLEKDSKSTFRIPPLYIIIAITQAILQVNITSR